MNKHTYREIASDRTLWAEYVDPSNLTTDAEWDNGTVEDRIAFIESCFGKEAQ